MLNIPCVIFAGGKSSRMGEDKALLPFGDAPSLAQFQYTRLKKLFSEVYISTKTDKFDFEAPLLLDTSDTTLYAPTAGFNTLFSKLAHERFFVISVDAPFVNEAEITRLLEEDRSTYDATIAQTATGIHPMCGIYHRTLYPKFQTMLEENNHKLGQLLKQVKTHFVPFKDEHPFTNINHPQEYKVAKILSNH